MRRLTPSERAEIARDAAQGQPLDFDWPWELDAYMDEAEWDLRRELTEEMREERW